MKTFEITEMGTRTTTVIEAWSDVRAVAEASGCAVHLVGRKIWKSEHGQRCYMPRDNTSRQWLVTDVKTE